MTSLKKPFLLLLHLIFEPQRFWSRTQLHSVKPCKIKGKE